MVTSLRVCIRFAREDGILSPDGHHINFTSEDLELATLFRECLGLDNKIGRKAREHEKNNKYFVVKATKNHGRVEEFGRLTSLRCWR